MAKDTGGIIIPNTDLGDITLPKKSAWVILEDYQLIPTEGTDTSSVTKTHYMDDFSGAEKDYSEFLVEEMGQDHDRLYLKSKSKLELRYFNPNAKYEVVFHYSGMGDNAHGSFKVMPNGNVYTNINHTMGGEYTTQLCVDEGFIDITGNLRTGYMAIAYDYIVEIS